MRDRRRYVVLGAGAVGAAIGGALHSAGHRALLIARGAHLEALRREGLTLATPTETKVMRVEAAASPVEVRWEADDVVLLCTKSQDSLLALGDLARATSIATPIVCMQNGVANERLAVERFSHVYGAVVFMPASLFSPGRVVVHSAPTLGGIDLGRFPSGHEDLAESIAHDLTESGFDARATANVMRLKYGKLLTNLDNVLQALVANLAPGSATSAGLQREALACYRAANIEFATKEEIYQRYAHVQDLPVNGETRRGGSTWQSLSRGGTLETDYLNGEIVRLGERHGLATPINRALVELAARAATEKWAPGSLSMKTLETAIAIKMEEGVLPLVTPILPE